MEALQQLEAVLCDPEGRVCINGSDGDRREIQEALQQLRAYLITTTAERDELVKDAARYNMALSGQCDLELCEVGEDGCFYGVSTVANAKDYSDKKLDAAIDAAKGEV